MDFHKHESLILPTIIKISTFLHDYKYSIKLIRNIYTMEYFSAIKRNTFESVLMRWMNLEPFIQSAVSQKEKYKYRDGEGQGSLACCSPWGYQESGTTE